MINKKTITALFVITFMIILQPVFSQQKEKPLTPENSSNSRQGSEGKTEGEASALNSGFKQESYYSESVTVISPDELLGITPEKAYELLGAPAEVFTMRGEKEWQDDAVFYFKNHIYLFWFKNRVWQLRADMRFKGSVLGLKPGMEKNEVALIMGKPFKKGEDNEIYLNPKNITRYETGFPVRMKIFYDSDERISDIYVYRGDF